MNGTTKISVCLNVAMLAVLAFVLTTSKPNNSRRNDEPLEGGGSPASSPSLESSGIKSAVLPSEVRPFRWSQLESSDYRLYVANLRGIGCPEQTIRDIITADVDNLYSTRRRELHLDGTGAGPWSQQEQNLLTASLLGSPPGSELLAGVGAHKAVPEAAVIPLVLQKVDVSALGLDSGQLKAIEDLREQFIAAIGGAGQEPSDPAYRERWDKAQPESDEMLRGMIGANAFQNFQLQAEGVHVGTGE
jgi:hypothetical protein